MSSLQEYAAELSKQWLQGDYNVTQMPGAAAPSTRKYYQNHLGYDFAAPAGTQIRSPIQGKVVFAGESSGWGNRVGVYDPTDNRTTYLSHLSKINVKPGDSVYKDMLLGLTGGVPGTAGAGNTTGAHLDITQYLGNKVFTPTSPSVQTAYKSQSQGTSYKDILNTLLSKYKDYGRPIAFSTDPEKLKALGRKGQIIKVNV